MMSLLFDVKGLNGVQIFVGQMVALDIFYQ